MTYHALARKWRPRTFTQLVGQDSVVKVLSNSLNLNRLHHAFIFTGTRGVGKTSVARLFAKAMNCDNAISSEPCLKCASCIAIEQGVSIDLVEIDAASNTGVDHMRELLEKVQYAPAHARFKIFLIDEVHMLSIQSFNALLKTLEEPPAHVKFLLATTDPQKVPKTVLSRCLQFHLRHIPPDIIARHLQHILDEEYIQSDPEALDILAKAAQGSLRDALSLLDQAIAGSDKSITVIDVKQILGYTQQDYALQLLQALCVRNAHDIHSLINAITDEGSHFLYVMDETLRYLHEIAVYQSTQSQGSISNQVKALAEVLSPEEVQLYYQIALKGTEDMHLAPTLAMGFHMSFLRMLTFKPASHISYSEIRESIPAAKINTDLKTPVVVTMEESKPIAEALLAQEKLLPDEAIVSQELLEEPYPSNLSWTEIIEQLKLQGLARTALQQTELLEKSENECLLKITPGHHALFTSAVRDKVQQALSQWYNEKIVLNFKIEDEVAASPARQHAQVVQQHLQEAEQSLLQDPVFQKIQQDFSATLVENSIEYAKNEI